MSVTLTIEVPVTFPHLGRGSHPSLDSGGEAARLPAGRVPRVARLMALALRLDELVRTGQVSSSSALIAAAFDWRQQRRRWRQLLPA
jgi:hypothetical protein